MTALDFPLNPSDNQTYGNYIYNATRGVWSVQANIPGISSRYQVSATAPSTPQNGDTWFNSSDGVTYMYYVDADSSQWIEVGGLNADAESSLNDFDDVNITSPADGQALVYDSATGDWVNETPASTLSSLTDTTITTPADGDVLKYNGTNWINEPTVINTDGNPGTKIYVGTTDPNISYTLEAGDIWIEV